MKHEVVVDQYLSVHIKTDTFTSLDSHNYDILSGDYDCTITFPVSITCIRGIVLLVTRPDNGRQLTTTIIAYGWVISVVHNITVRLSYIKGTSMVLHGVYLPCLYWY